MSESPVISTMVWTFFLMAMQAMSIPIRRSTPFCLISGFMSSAVRMTEFCEGALSDGQTLGFTAHVFCLSSPSLRAKSGDCERVAWSLCARFARSELPRSI